MKTLITFISFTKNNVFFSLLNFEKQILASKSLSKRKGSKKLNLLSVNLLVDSIMKLIKTYGYKRVHLRLRGVNKFKNTIIRTLKKTPFSILTIIDLTSSPYNGCVKRRKRRL